MNILIPPSYKFNKTTADLQELLAYQITHEN